MKVIEHLEKARNPLISFEIIPLPRGGDINKLYSIIDDIIKFNPPFIDVTSHSAEIQYEETPSGIRKKVKRKRPGTIGISVAIKNKYNIDTVPHLLCNGFTREETEDALIELNYLGIENVLAVRGDDPGFVKPVLHGRTCNNYAVELVEQIASMNNGKYLGDDLLDATATNFCIGVGCYPEKHFEAPNISTDLKFVKKKIEKGAHYIVTQMFFNNAHYFNYVEKCRESGINVPIIPGLKILSNKKQLTTIPKNFYVEIPDEFSNEVLEAKDEHVIDVGVEWAARQCEELFNSGVKSAHFYIMQNTTPIKKLFKRLKL